MKKCFMKMKNIKYQEMEKFECKILPQSMKSIEISHPRILQSAPSIPPIMVSFPLSSMLSST